MNLKEKILNVINSKCYIPKSSYAGRYGCANVLLGYPRGKLVEATNYRMDYLSYDRLANTFYTYTIAMNMDDLDTSKFHFIGNCNYLVITENLYYDYRESVYSILNNYPNIGLILYQEQDNTIKYLKHYKEIPIEDKVGEILKNCLLRKLFYKSNGLNEQI